MATLITKNSSTASAVPAAGDLVKGELAVNVTDKKVYTKDNSAAVVKLVGSLGNQEASAVAITGGTINGTTIGATTPSTGAFTTASASSGFTGNLTGNVTGNVSGTAANVTGVVAIANGGTGLSALGTGVQSALGQNVTGSGGIVLATSPSLTTPNLGTPSAAVLTNATGLPLTTGVTGTLGVANGGTGITAFGTGVATALGQNVTGSGGIVLATSPSLTTPNLGTPSAATLTNATGLPISTGVSGLGTGVATALAVNTGSSGAFVVNGGALGTPSSGTLTNATGLPLSTGVTGTLATTNGGTGLTSFTANGVVYASSSSALTTGSALTFDGTNLGVPAEVYRTTDSSYLRLAGGNPAATGANVLMFGSTHASLPGALYFSATGTGNIVTATVSGSHIWNINTEQMRLTSTGLGIGTSSPAYKLDVNGTAYATAGVFNTGANNVTINAGGIYNGSVTNSLLYVVSDGGSASGMVAYGSTHATKPSILELRSGSAVSATLNSSGNLGIGTSSPAYKLDVRGVIAGGNGTIVGGISFSTRSEIGAISNHNLGLITNNVTQAILDTSGNLGLGVTPSAWNITALQVKNGSMYGAGSTEAGWYSNAYYNSGWKYISNGASAGYVQNGNHQWFVAGSGTAGDTISFTQAMTLTASGQLLVGTTTYPTDDNTAIGFGVSSTGEMRAAVNNASAAMFKRASSDGDIVVFRKDSAVVGTIGAASGGIYFASGGTTERVRITSGGALLVGTTTATVGTAVGARIVDGGARLEVASAATTNANIGLSQYSTGAASYRFYVGYDGTVYATSTTISAISDQRLKENVRDLDVGLSAVMALKPRKFDWKAGKGKDIKGDRGFIAQEFEQVFPDLIDEWKDPAPEGEKPYKSVRQDLIPVLVKAIQEQQAIITDLRARVAQLEAK